MATLSSRGFPRVVTPWKQFPILSRRARYEHRFPFPFCQCLSTGRMTPKIASMWNSVIPKFLRNGDRKASKHGTDIGIIERNPAVFYILMFILIGSQAIHLLQLRTSHENFLRSTNSKIRQLSEVIDKLKNGEEVDVKKALGTGNKASEDEWEEELVLREIEREELDWRSKLDSVQAGEKPPQSEATTSGDETVKKSSRPPRFY
ncbi:hypothetical protein MaudMau93_006821 [Microsporum audouinii]